MLVAVLTVASLCAGLMQLGASITRRQSAANHRKLAFYMAEAGLAEAFAGLTVGKTGNVGTAAEPAAFGTGLFWVVATENPDDTVTLESTGLVGSGRAVLSMVAARGESSVASLGMFSDGDLRVEPGTLIDGYDSEEDTYRNQKNPDPSLPAPPPAPARLGTNGGLFVSGTETEPTVIDGSATPGPGSDLLVEGTVDISGSTAAARASTPLPPVELPGLPLEAGIEIDGATPYLLQPGELGFEYVTVRAGAQLVLVGPATLEIGQLWVEPTADLRFETDDGPVELYVTDTIVLEEGASVSTSNGDTTRVTIQIAGSPAEPARFAAKGLFRGVVYAPEASVELAGGFKLFGSVVARELRIGAGAKLHFDLRLDRAARESALPRLLSWRIVELATTAGMGASADPFYFLGLDRASLPGPAEAHADQTLRIEYLDLTLTPQVYDGPESGFDWSQVSSASLVTRDGATVVEPKDIRKDIVTRSLEDPGISSFDLKRVLKTNSPLTEAQIAEAMRRLPLMVSPDLLEVLDVNLPLADPLLVKAVGSDALSSADLATLLIGSVPLSAAVLDAAENRAPPMNAGDLAAVQTAQGL